MSYKTPILIIGSLIVSIIHLYISLSGDGICTYNEGVAFGWFESNLAYALQVVGLIAIVIIFYKTRLIPLLIMLIAGFSNLLDRIINGGVCDYIDFSIVVGKMSYNSPLFNMNDAIISLSLIFLILVIYQSDEKKL